MAQVGTVSANKREFMSYTGVAGANDNDIVIETEDVSRFNFFELSSAAGAMDVEISHDGSTFIGPISLGDLGATTLDPVVVTAASRRYAFRGKIRKIRIRQNGATPVTGAILACGIG